MWEITQVESEDGDLFPAIVRTRDNQGLALSMVDGLLDLSINDPEAFDLLSDILDALLERIKLEPVRG